MNISRVFGPTALATVIGLSGCAGSSGASAKGTPGPEQREQTMLKFAQCMRDHGVDMPDPATNSGGELRIERPLNARLDNEADRAKAETARDACDKYLAGIRQQFTPQQRAQMQDKMVEFAKCMRSNGIDMPDPDFSQGDRGGFRQRISSNGVNPEDPGFRAAAEKCQQEVFGGQRGPGGGRGGIFFAPGPAPGGSR